MGQEPGMWHLTDEEGLPSMTVYNIAQDSKGFIWMGTEKGICRFDGKIFKYFKSAEFNDNEILKIEIDSLDRVWFINLSGQFFYIEEELIHDGRDLFTSDFDAIVDLKIMDHTVWISVKKDNGYAVAYCSFDTQGSFLSPFYYDALFFRVFPFFEKMQSIYFVGTPFGDGPLKLIHLDKIQQTLAVEETFDRVDFRGYRFAFVNHDQDLAHFKKSRQPVRKYKGKKLTPFLEFEKEIIVNDLAEIDDDIWISTSQGVFRRSAIDSRVLKEPYLLNNIAANHIFIDQEENKWISTTGHGVYVITSPQTKVFQSANFDLPNNEIYSLEYDDSEKRLLVGHDKGLVSAIDDQLNNKVYELNVSGRTLKTIVKEDGGYWFVNDDGLIELNKDHVLKNRMASSAKALLNAKDKSLWYASFCCVNRILKDFAGDFGEEDLTGKLKGILNKKTYALYQAFSDAIWMGTVNGIYIYEQEKVIPFLEKEKHIPYNVSSISQTADSVVWIGTRGEGLIGIKNKKVICRYKESDGLASNTIKNIRATDQHLWISTDNGLNKLNLKTKQWEWVNKTDGLPSNEVNDIVVVDDQVWVGTAKGLVNFSIDATHFNSKPPIIHITGLKLEDRDTTLMDSIELAYDQNSVHVDFIGIGFRGKGDISYQYKITGVDKNWVRTTSRFARYPNLVPGDYLFEVLAINEDQVLSETSAKLYLSISPPWWNTWLFRIFSLLSLIGLASYFVNARIQRQKQEQAFFNQVNELKTQALRSQMNPHFIFNALNAIQKFLIGNDREEAMRYLSRFGKLIRLIFLQSQERIISLEDELEFLNLYLDLEKLRFMEKVVIQMEVSPELLEVSDEIEIPPLLIQPIIENSFKHGFLYKEEPGQLKINFSRKEAYLICTIEDDGIGRKKAAELGQIELKDRSSSGLKIAQERLDIYESEVNTNWRSGIKVTDLHEEDGEVRGTLVEIKIYCKHFELIEKND